MVKQYLFLIFIETLSVSRILIFFFFLLKFSINAKVKAANGRTTKKILIGAITQRMMEIAPPAMIVALKMNIVEALNAAKDIAASGKLGNVFHQKNEHWILMGPS